MSQNVSHSGRYTHGHGASTVASHARRTAENSAAYLLPHLREGMSLLDLGSGPATITLDLAARVAPGRVVGVENAQAAVDLGVAEAARRDDTTTRFELADALSLPFDDATFDVAHAHQVLQHLVDPVGALRELARVVRPGGLIAVRDADYAAMFWTPELPGLELWRSIYRDVCRANGAEPDAGRHLRGWALAAGLTDLEVTTSTWTYADDESTQWWGTSQADRYTQPSFASQALAAGASQHDIDQIGEAWREWAARPDAFFTIVHTEVLARRR